MNTYVLGETSNSSYSQLYHIKSAEDFAGSTVYKCYQIWRYTKEIDHYVAGNEKGIAQSSNRSMFPNDGEKDGTWYIREGIE